MVNAIQDEFQANGKNRTLKNILTVFNIVRLDYRANVDIFSAVVILHGTDDIIEGITDYLRRRYEGHRFDGTITEEEYDQSVADARHENRSHLKQEGSS